ncbi:MAG: hypothetical protein M1827_005236 [Pycnora praestabilis]|nr:MAG: hypothetical protein M1827_005236 [Pycnora praestabilis]
MLFDDEDAAPLKTWIVKRLEDISDADSDVLADYVLALVRTEASDDEVRKNSIENLEDFLKEHTATFVDDIFTTIKTKSFLPGYNANQPTSPILPSFDTPVIQPGNTYGQLGPRGGFHGASHGRNDQSRKRSYNDRESGESKDARDSHYGRNAGGDRAVKQMRRGGPRGGKFDNFGGRGGRQQGQSGQDVSMGGLPGLSQASPGGFPNMPGMPPPPPGFPFDPQDPMSAIMAMQAMGFPPLPGMPAFPQAGSPTGFGPSRSPIGFPQTGAQKSPGADVPAAAKIGERCRDYDQKGFCALGSTCPYEHGNDHIVAPCQGDEYDPANSSIMMDIQKTTSNGANGHGQQENHRGNDRGRVRGRGRGDRGGFISNRRGRAEFSHAGPNQDRSITTIVVEQIPEEKFDAASVREFFAEFGNIIEVTMKAYKRLAVVKFDDYFAAKNAYESPRVIFDNRFVKVYWYKPDALPTPSANGGAKAGSPTHQTSQSEEPVFDKEEFDKKQAELQKAHDEKMKKLKETESASDALKKKLELQAEERKKLLDKLAAKTGSKAASGSPISPSSSVAQNGTNGTDGAAKKANTQTEALRAQLAALEAEAKSMGLDTALPDESWAPRGRGRGRGTYRGRAAYAPRGRGFDSSRGGYRGRGGNEFGTGNKYRLDNRTRKVAVSGTDFDTNKDESLRQYLLEIGEFENIEPNPDRPDSQLILFKDRATAEKFFYGPSEIPSVGKLEFSWINMPLPPITSLPSATTSTKQQQDTNQQQQNDGDSTIAEGDAGPRHVDVDYDVADDDDRWMVE